MKCVHELMKVICEEKGTPFNYEKEYKTLDDAKKENKSYNIFLVKDGVEYSNVLKRQIKGGVWVLEGWKNKEEFKTVQFSIDTIFDKIFAQRKRYLALNELPKPNGTYVDSLGGGWSSKVSKWNYKGEEYADMECNCF